MKRLWKNKLIVKFFLSYLAVVLLLFVFFYLYSGAIVKNSYISSLSKKLEEEARIATRLLPVGLEGEALDKICRDLARDLGIRVTVIALNGKVQGDSDQSSVTMENHATRPEVLEALSKGAGRSIRYSTTVRYEMLYQAILEREKNRIVRISVPLHSVEEAVGSIRRAILAGLILVSGLGLLLALLFSRKFGRRVMHMAEFSQKVSQGSFPNELIQVKGEDELSILEKHLNEMSRSIQEKIKGIVAEKEKVDSILKGMIEGVLVVDTQGRVILLNQNAKKMFDLPSSQNFQGASLLEISRHPEMKKLMERVLACDCSKECFAQELSFDERKWFRVNAVSLRDGNEKPLGYILVFHDVTELKRLETVRSDFVANVSHELRTPVTAIRGYAETLLHSPPSDPKDAEHFLGIIHRHSERLGRLIDDLLTLSDLESGQIRLEMEKLQAADLIGRVLEIFQDQAAKKNVALLQSVDARLPPIIGDADRLQQLLINLIDNALKYTPSGGRIEVAARLWEGNRQEARGGREAKDGNKEGAARASRLTPHAPGKWVELSVADTGCGISEKDLPRLTERFYRVDKARSRELGGTGLGLAIVKHIVQAHGGHLRIESQIQKGTTVQVSLPVENGETN